MLGIRENLTFWWKSYIWKNSHLEKLTIWWKYQFFVGFSPNARFLQELSNDCQVYTLLIRLGHGKYGVCLSSTKDHFYWEVPYPTICSWTTYTSQSIFALSLLQAPEEPRLWGELCGRTYLGTNSDHASHFLIELGYLDISKGLLYAAVMYTCLITCVITFLMLISFVNFWDFVDLEFLLLIFWQS